ncbi:MAG: NAD-dependent epimerase/dehydratase family protein [Candidatus Sungbacteria bacterium]|uniref:NAD-dependent epimerase/dehydratase family protein n=1 Tax=Candidatus Sungiibacteriota bacterium TaxID=2750080 RepID=A0A932QZ42_9BACT|nr:NAD-dependent epimerase/dehydratase family protein [Candidatus Sungbacteria bacterium]
MNGRILITGGLGFIGSHLADVFAAQGMSVRILDIPERPMDVPAEREYVRGSVAQKEAWIRALESVDYVVHLAVYPGYHFDFSTYFSVNAAGTALLYEVAVEKKLPLRHIIIASSQSVYGEGKYRCPQHGIFYARARDPKDLRDSKWDVRCPQDGGSVRVVPSQEEDPLHPVSPYGASKMASEEIGLTLGRQYDIPSTALRFAMVSGAHPSMKRPYAGAVKFFTEEALAGRPIPIHEDGQQMRDFVNVKDVGQAHLAVLGNPAAYFQAFNVGGGSPRRLLDLAEEVCRALGVPCESVFKKEFRPFTPRHWVMDPQKLGGLGWAPQYSFEEGVKELVAAYKKFPHEFSS